ncbi:MAG: hypothetical protein ACJ72H_16260 [Candidatus Sulfotelmatobacter sp.]
MAKRGRPPKGEYPEKKRVFASRVREDTWKMLQRAAAKSGRSVSQEFEHRLRLGLDKDEKVEDAFGDLQTYALMKLAAQAIDSMTALKQTRSHWTANVTTFDEALQLINRTLQAFRPHALTANSLVSHQPELGMPALIEVVREIHSADASRPLDKLSERERRLIRLQRELGHLTNRPLRMVKAKDRRSDPDKK